MSSPTPDARSPDARSPDDRSPDDRSPDVPTVDALLAAAVAAVDGTQRSGQVEMAHAVAQAIADGEHLLVQAGTGTGKSLAYLVPALRHDEPVIIATATIALQRQLVDRDLPRLLDAVEPVLHRRPTFAMLKGRSNYLCLHRLNAGDDVPDDQDALFDPAPTSKAGRDVLRIRSWAERTTTGDRDEIAPAPDERAWRAMSVTPHECLGAARCPFGDDCFAELARERAREADLVVTNHAMLAIDALSDARLLPEHDVVIVDEGHELADRATGAVTDELTAAMVERAARRCRRYAGDRDSDLLLDAADLLARALEESPEGRIDELRGALFDALVGVRDAGHATLTAIGSIGKDDADDVAGKTRARAAVEEVHEIAGRIVAAGTSDVVWLTRPERRPPSLWRAPLFVGGLLRDTLFGDATVVMTSATLTLGGDFDAVASSVGLVADKPPTWRGLDAGSPFDYQRQGILYMAAHLPPPGRDGLSEAFLDELADLVTAAGGRTLGLFSSMRAAKQAADAMRDRLDVPILCQGDDATGELVRRFAGDAATCLFGTLSLWQGVDVPGSALQLVVIDRLPFPRPDDPLASARQRAVEAAGGNGFLAVAATQAALRLAQGSGRLIRRCDDRGVVAVLDSRLANARYGGFVRRSMPDFWSTTDAELVRRSLTTIDAHAPEPLPVPDRVWASDDDAAAAQVAQAEAEAEQTRKGRRWTDEEHAQLLAGFAAGTPVGLLADELGRTPSALVTRLRQAGVTAKLVWGTGEEVSRADRELGYALTTVPPPALDQPQALVDALAVDGWPAQLHDDVVHVTRDGVEALVGWDDPTTLLMGDATSRWLIADVDACPAGPNGTIVKASP